MPEETTTTTTSESASGAPDGGAGGAGGDGGAGGTAAADAFAAEKSRLEALARDRQSAADKAAAEAARLKAELDAIKGASGGETPALTPEAVQEQVRQVMRQEQARSRELASAATIAKEQYPNALRSVVEADYESAEEMLEAVRSSHETITSQIEETLKAREEELRQRYAERLGELPAPVEATTEGSTSTGDPTIEQLSAMTTDQLDALDKEHPGLIDRVMRSADQLTP